MSNSTSDTSRSAPDSNTAPSADNDDVVRIVGGFDDDGTPYARAVLTPNEDQRTKEILVDHRPAIPVIFLPGVMGTLLSDKTTGKPVWSPPNLDAIGSGIVGVASVLAGWPVGAAKRAKHFDPDQAVVDPRGPIKLGNSGLTEEEARRRGWGALHRWSYQPTLAWLEYTLNHPMLAGLPHGEWVQGDAEGVHAALKAVLGTDPADYGGYGQGRQIDANSEAFKSLVRYRYRVYAIGYNWLKSNDISGKQVLDGFDYTDQKTKKVTRVMGIREICRENNVEKAIIITHSMGGLVARMASQFHGGADAIYGVIHGAQPATGAPLFAKRFRTGAEGTTFQDRLANQSLLGRNAAEFVAVASSAEGPMELAPMPDYIDGAPWWIFTDKKGKEIMALPEDSALDEIYINDKWYALLPDSSLLDPAGIVKKKLEEQRNPACMHDYFKQVMADVVDRQKRLRNNYHPNTYAIYGNGELTKASAINQEPPKLETSAPEEKLMTWGKVVWQGDFPEGVDEKQLKAAQLVHDNHKGELTIIVGGRTVKVTVQQKAIAQKNGERDNGIIAGDGTVPIWSAEAQARGVTPNLSMASGKAKGVQMVFVQGGYEHQFCFDHPWSRWATLYSMAQVAHSIKARFQ
ncbi:esterase/lipase family protein [Dyella flava]|uniref:Alpha/beta hydrolase n=1 Tax=Dyella flava TaxID=1920170 RepID=A0ABS2K3W7_9GAMM|nr:hypothetical protein [Dyella flava]MBM7125931.1 alpha/beta hydrolase [Dyella flava]GLQ48552.1 hypothetical protein GCM10010872_00010 [Dyella flava]